MVGPGSANPAKKYFADQSSTCLGQGWEPRPNQMFKKITLSSASVGTKKRSKVLSRGLQPQPKNEARKKLGLPVLTTPGEPKYLLASATRWRGRGRFLELLLDGSIFGIIFKIGFFLKNCPLQNLHSLSLFIYLCRSTTLPPKYSGSPKFIKQQDCLESKP